MYIKRLEEKAKAEDVDAQLNLGYMYENGENVVINYEKAIEWYTKAANQGNVDAKCCLAVMHAEGKVTKLDRNKAIEILDSIIPKNNLEKRAIDRTRTNCEYIIRFAKQNKEPIEKKYQNGINIKFSSFLKFFLLNIPLVFRLFYAK